MILITRFWASRNAPARSMTLVDDFSFHVQLIYEEATQASKQLNLKIKP